MAFRILLQDYIMESNRGIYYGIILRNYTTGLYYRITILNYIAGLYNGIVLRVDIEESYYGVILRDWGCIPKSYYRIVE